MRELSALAASGSSERIETPDGAIVEWATVTVAGVSHAAIGYTRTTDGRMFAYIGARLSERPAYNVCRTDVIATYALTTWNGERIGTAYLIGTGPTRRDWYIGSRLHYWRAVTDDGARWHGRNAGSGLAVKLRRCKG